MPIRSATAGTETYTALSALHVYCFRYSVRAAAACALGDDVVLWCHAIAQQLCLTDPANQCLIAAAQRHIAAKSQQQQQAACTLKAWDAPAGAQHRHTDRAQSGGLMTSSDDSSNLNVEAATAQTLTQPNSIAMEGVVVQGGSSGAGGSAHALHAVPARQQMAEASAGRMGDTSRAPLEANGGPVHDDGGVDAMDHDGDVEGMDALITGGLGNDDVNTHVDLEQDAAEVHAQQLKGIDKADSCQLAPSRQAAECDQQLQPGHQPGQQPGVSQRPSFSQQAGISQQKNCNQNTSRSQQQCNAGPKVVGLQGRLGVQHCCQKMQVTLQVAFCFTPHHCACPEP